MQGCNAPGRNHEQIRDLRLVPQVVGVDHHNGQLQVARQRAKVLCTQGRMASRETGKSANC